MYEIAKVHVKFHEACVIHAITNWGGLFSSVGNICTAGIRLQGRDYSVSTISKTGMPLSKVWAASDGHHSSIRLYLADLFVTALCPITHWLMIHVAWRGKGGPRNIPVSNSPRCKDLDQSIQTVCDLVRRYIGCDRTFKIANTVGFISVNYVYSKYMECGTHCSALPLPCPGIIGAS